MNNSKNIDEYISKFPDEVKNLLEQIRTTIKKAAPTAVETIAYAIPTFKLNGKAIIHFAAYKNHIGLYATPTSQAAFIDELATYKQSKGSVQLPLNKDIPLDLIARITKFNAEQN